MSRKTLVAALVAAVPALAIQAFVTEASAHLQAPLIPTALVEDVKGSTTDVEFMDYVGGGQVIKLGPGDVVVLSYLKSCQHETITGGTVLVGTDHSEVQGGEVVRTTVPCDGGKIRLSSAEASKSAASAFRLQSAEIEPRVYGNSPVFRLPKLDSNERTLTIVRKGHPKDRHEIKIDDATAAAGFYDLGKDNVSLAKGGVYDATIGTHTMTFQVDAKAQTGAAPVVSRLLRFQ
jgi:hypothetical protein